MNEPVYFLVESTCGRSRAIRTFAYRACNHPVTAHVATCLPSQQAGNIPYTCGVNLKWFAFPVLNVPYWLSDDFDGAGNVYKQQIRQVSDWQDYQGARSQQQRPWFRKGWNLLRDWSSLMPNSWRPSGNTRAPPRSGAGQGHGETTLWSGKPVASVL